VIGPVGPVGALGVLGPIGAHGYKADENGEYRDVLGNIQMTYNVPYDTTTNRSFDLYQNYGANYAQSHILDTSFMVQDDLCNSPKQTSRYTFISAYNQIVSVVVVPTNQNSVLLLTLTNNLGVIIATSTMTADTVNFMLFTSHLNETYTVTVTTTHNAPSTEYRLFVTGSYSYLNQNNMVGTYILTSLN